MLFLNFWTSTQFFLLQHYNQKCIRRKILGITIERLLSLGKILGITIDRLNKSYLHPVTDLSYIINEINES